MLHYLLYFHFGNTISIYTLDMYSMRYHMEFNRGSLWSLLIDVTSIQYIYIYILDMYSMSFDMKSNSGFLNEPIC